MLYSDELAGVPWPAASWRPVLCHEIGDAIDGGDVVLRVLGGQVGWLGSLEILEPVQHPILWIELRQEGEMARAEGWALIDGKTPALAVLKIDGTRSGETSSFQSRADVNSFFGRDVGSCAWRIDFQTADLMRGSHQAQVLVSQGAGQPGLVLGRATTFRVSD